MGEDAGALARSLAEWVAVMRGHPTLAHALVSAALLAASLAAVAPLLVRPGRPLTHRVAASDGFFLAVVAGVVALCRLPLLATPQLLNLDEAQLLAQAMRHLIAPVPWVGVDTTTSGPLNSYVLSAALGLGAPVAYPTARAVGLACWLGALAFTYRALRERLPLVVARLAILPATLFLALAVAPDYVHYSSEPVSVLLLAAAVCCGVRGLARPDAPGWFAGAGLALGAVPFAKLQAAPIALTLGALGVAVCGWQRRERGLRPLRNLVLGALALPCLLLAWVASQGGLLAFWRFYIEAGLDYASRSLTPGELLRLLAWGHFFPFLLVVVLLGLAGAVCVLPPLRCRRTSPSALLATLAFLAASLLAIAVPGKGFPHYALLLVLPLTLLAGLALANLPWDAGGGRRDRALGLAVVAGLLTLQVALNPLPLTGYDPRARPAPFAPGEVEAALRRLGDPGDTLAIWGWMPQYYVASGLPPASRHVIAWLLISPGRQRDYYRETFLADLRASPPLLVLEAVGPGNFRFEDRSLQGVESFPALRSFLDERYCELRDRPSYRLYLRDDARERAARLGGRRCLPAGSSPTMRRP